MNLQSIVILAVMVVLFALAVTFIAKNGGWQQGCGGNCKDCKEKCESKAQPKQ